MVSFQCPAYPNFFLVSNPESAFFRVLLAFETVGNEGWNWEELLKYMKKVQYCALRIPQKQTLTHVDVPLLSHLLVWRCCVRWLVNE